MVLDDSINGHHVSRTIRALRTVDKDRAIGRITDDLQEFAHIFVFRMPCFAVQVSVLKMGSFEHVPVTME